jgi:parallel beta-helix repeat protein
MPYIQNASSTEYYDLTGIVNLSPNAIFWVSQTLYDNSSVISDALSAGEITDYSGVGDPVPDAVQVTSRINIVSYGAVGNGTTDDYSAILTAVAELEARAGGELYIPRGVFRTTGAISIPSNVTVVGEGESSILFLDGATGSDAAIYSKGTASVHKTGVVFRDFKVIMDTYFARDGIQFYYVDDGLIENCMVENTADYDVTLTTSTAGTTTYTATSAIDGTAWDLSEAVVGQQATDGTNTGLITDVDDANDTITVDAWSPSTPTDTTACIVKAKAEIIEEGIVLYYCTNCNVKNCITKWVTQAGIEAAGSSDITLEGNHLLWGTKAPLGATVTDGIYLWGSTDCIVTGNTCQGNYGCGIRTRTEALIPTQVERITITNNHCDDNLYYGIASDPAATYKGIANADISDNACRNNSLDGIGILNQASIGDSDNIIVSGNILRENVDDGITLATIKDSIITNNICDGNGGDGINIVTSTTNLVTHNTSINNGSNGIALDAGSDDNLVLDNYLAGNVSTQLSEAVGSSNTVKLFADGDDTPSVAGTIDCIFKTANTNPVTITDFDDGVKGQRVTIIIADANTTIDFTASGLKGNVGADWSAGNGDHMVCVYDGTDWYCTISDNTA